LNLIFCHFFTPFIKRKTPAIAGVFMSAIQVSEISYPTQKNPGVSSPEAATGTDTGVFLIRWHHDFILYFNSSRQYVK
jgi:hypothetical protein